MNVDPSHLDRYERKSDECVNSSYILREQNDPPMNNACKTLIADNFQTKELVFK